jgi:integrase
MSTKHSTERPTKPTPDFPLFPHRCGSWAKKIRGAVHYFGGWGDPDGALAKYNAQKADLHAGRRPAPAADDPEPDSDGTIKSTVNAFLNAKMARVKAGELSNRTWIFYKGVCAVLVKQFGGSTLVADLRPRDFEDLRRHMETRWGPLRRGNAVIYVRGLFKYALEAELIDRLPRYGPTFVRPTAKTVRLHRVNQGPNLFAAEEVRRMLDAADVTLRALLLLAINCGFGNSDVGRLPLAVARAAVDSGWIDYPRMKTGVPRRCPLWPETVQAIRQALADRPEPRRPVDADLAFLTPRGKHWASDASLTRVTWATAALLRRLDINGRKRLGFYTLRHNFETVGGEAKDQVAVNAIMGHVDSSMAGHYRERIDDGRLVAVSECVRSWLFGTVNESANL